MKQQKRTIEEHHHHYSYDWSKFMIKTFIAFLYFILIDGVKIYNPIIEEFDRTYCIEFCNDMYLKLRGVK